MKVDGARLDRPPTRRAPARLCLPPIGSSSSRAPLGFAARILDEVVAALWPGRRETAPLLRAARSPSATHCSPGVRAAAPPGLARRLDPRARPARIRLMADRAEVVDLLSPRFADLAASWASRACGARLPAGPSARAAEEPEQELDARSHRTSSAVSPPTGLTATTSRSSSTARSAPLRLAGPAAPRPARAAARRARHARGVAQRAPRCCCSTTSSASSTTSAASACSTCSSAAGRPSSRPRTGATGSRTDFARVRLSGDGVATPSSRRHETAPAELGAALDGPGAARPAGPSRGRPAALAGGGRRAGRRGGWPDGERDGRVTSGADRRSGRRSSRCSKTLFWSS